MSDVPNSGVIPCEIPDAMADAWAAVYLDIAEKLEAEEQDKAKQTADDLKRRDR